MDFGMSLPAPPHPFLPPSHSLPGDWVTWTLILPALQAAVQTMELWVQLKQAGLEPLGLGPPPQAFRLPLPEGNPAQTLMSSGTELGDAREPLLWLWEELGNLRRVDVQLLGQLCHLGLEMGALREELLTILEEEEGEEEEAAAAAEESCIEEEGGQEEGHPGASYPAQRLPDFEMTI